MRCSQLENRLNDLLDRREDPRSDAAVAEHIASCRRCNQVTAAFVAVTEGAATLAKTVACRTAEGSRRGVRPLSRFGAASSWRSMAVGAVTTAAMLLFLLQRQGSQNHVARHDVVSTAPATRASVRSQPAKPRRPVVVKLAQHTGRAYVDLVHGTVRGVDEAVMLAGSIPPPREFLSPLLFPDVGMLRQLGDDWAPMADQTLEALEQVFAAGPPQST